MATLTSRIEGIVARAAAEAEPMIRDAVRRRMAQSPKPAGFVFAMGRYFWIDSKGETGAVMSKTMDIDDACAAFLDAFGTMTWRIDYEDNGKLVERMDW